MEALRPGKLIRPQTEYRSHARRGNSLRTVPAERNVEFRGLFGRLCPDPLLFLQTFFSSDLIRFHGCDHC